LPLAAVALLGSPGGVAVLILVFMAVTSAASAELIAVSSIYTYDIYRTYITSHAPGKKVINQSHYSVIAFGILMGVLAVILNYIGISLGYLYLLMGIITSPAVIPVAFTLTWRKQSKEAAIGSSIIGVVCGITAWLVTAGKLSNEITIASTGADYPMLAGNLVSLGTSGIVATIWSLLKPDNFDFNITKTQLEILTDDEEGKNANTTFSDKELDPERLRKAFVFAVRSSIALTLILIIIWPLPMYFSRYIFSKPFFTFWVALSMIWAIMASIAVAIYPLYESVDSIKEISAGIFGDITGKKRPKTTREVPESSPDMNITINNITINNEKDSEAK